MIAPNVWEPAECQDDWNNWEHDTGTTAMLGGEYQRPCLERFTMLAVAVVLNAISAALYAIRWILP